MRWGRKVVVRLIATQERTPAVRSGRGKFTGRKHRHCYRLRRQRRPLADADTWCNEIFSEEAGFDAEKTGLSGTPKSTS
jgi:hypothetical protein